MAEPKPEPEIADASLLFGQQAPQEQATAENASGTLPTDAYEVAGGDAEPMTRIETSAAPISPPRPRRKEADARPARSKPREESSGVDQLWSRGTEWGGSLLRLGVGLIVAAFLLYATFSLDALFLWFVLMLASFVALIVLAYPIFITLERPVRITPEQAIKDYFGAFSHLVPHTKRMWLLLAADGRTSPSYRSFGEFHAYWKGKVAAWKSESGAAGPLNPFEIEVVDFKSDKSAGLNELEAAYTARVRRRGVSDSPVATYNLSVRLVRGSDKMWYLDSGTLP